jgi:hypothetical protein
MARAIRQIGLKLLGVLLRVCLRPAAAGWQPSRRRPELADR